MKDLFILLGIAALMVGIFAGAIHFASTMNEGQAETDIVIVEEELPYLGTMPEIEGIADWINSEALTTEDLKGKVVLVDFWTYSCINCIRTLPYIADWWTKYESDEFVILGVHTPEFEFEKEYDNVVAAAEQYGLTFPIAQDNDYTTWRNFNNRYWPAKYLFDREGNLRYTHFGEGKYDETESAIQALLGVEMELTETELPDFANINTRETYFGYWRSENFASPEAITEDAPATYSLPEALELGEWAFEGSWDVQYQHARANEAGARFQFHYSASIANIVMSTNDGSLQEIVVKLDGEMVPAELLGAHVVKDEATGSTFVQVEFSDLYELINTEPGDHILELEVLEPGLEIYAITFG